MAHFYQPGHRALQREFESTALADRLEALIVHSELDAEAQAFIEQQDHFFLSTLGADGFPSVSYKGGDSGFVKIDDPKTLRFPCFDGNGMWLSMGNIADHGKVGLLFMNAVTPHRVRIHGVAQLVRDPSVLKLWKDVGLAVEVKIQTAWINCPRYIHPMEKRGQSEHVPSVDRETAPAEWKALEVVADVLPPQPHEVKK